MSKKSKKFETENDAATSAPAPISAGELAVPTANEADTKPKKERAPRIVRPRFRLINSDGAEIHFTHYALPTRRQSAGNITIDGKETSFTVTKSQSRDKTEDRAYSYFTLPNGATGYVSMELLAGTVYTTKELPPAEPFGGKQVGKAKQEAEPAAA